LQSLLTDFFGLVTVRVLDKPIFLLTENQITEILGLVTLQIFLEPKNWLTDFQLTETLVNWFCTTLSLGV